MEKGYIYIYIYVLDQRSDSVADREDKWILVSGRGGTEGEY